MTENQNRAERRSFQVIELRRIRSEFKKQTKSLPEGSTYNTKKFRKNLFYRNLKNRADGITEEVPMTSDTSCPEISANTKIGFSVATATLSHQSEVSDSNNSFVFDEQIQSSLVHSNEKLDIASNLAVSHQEKEEEEEEEEEEKDEEEDACTDKRVKKIVNPGVDRKLIKPVVLMVIHPSDIVSVICGEVTLVLPRKSIKSIILEKPPRTYPSFMGIMEEAFPGITVKKVTFSPLAEKKKKRLQKLRNKAKTVVPKFKKLWKKISY